MAIPQPTFYGPTGAQNMQNSFQAVGQGLGQMNQSVQESRRLKETQRQYNTNNRIDYYKGVVDSQYGGNWAAFIRGPETGVDDQGRPMWAGNDVAKGMFNDLYGDKADSMYGEALQTTPETLQQMAESMLLNKYRRGSGDQQPQQQQQPQMKLL